MGKTVNVTGATGLVGKALVKQLLDEDAVEKVNVFVRRSTGIRHPKLREQVIDFEHPESWKPLVAGDVLFSTLGTTLKKAKSKANQYRVDFTYQYEFARAAAENGVPVYVLVSSAGADSRSAIFYSRMKGELDEAVRLLPFAHCTILRPSILVGAREERRPAEVWAAAITTVVTRYLFREYRPVAAETVARAMIAAAFHPGSESQTVVELDEIFTLAGNRR